LVEIHKVCRKCRTFRIWFEKRVLGYCILGAGLAAEWMCPFTVEELGANAAELRKKEIEQTGSSQSGTVERTSQLADFGILVLKPGG
jgi:hypothetical protein